MGMDPIIYIVGASLLSGVCGVLAFRTVAAERRRDHNQAHKFEQIRIRPQFNALRSLKDVLAIVVGIAAGIGAIFYFYKFITLRDPESHYVFGWIALGLAVVAFVCGLIYFLGHVPDEEEIHVVD